MNHLGLATEGGLVLFTYKFASSKFLMHYRSLWKSSLIIPVVVSALSLATLVLHRFIQSQAFQKIRSRVLSGSTYGDLDTSRNITYAAQLRANVISHGKGSIFWHKFARFLACIVLLGLAIICFLQQGTAEHASVLLTSVSAARMLISYFIHLTRYSRFIPSLSVYFLWSAAAKQAA